MSFTSVASFHWFQWTLLACLHKLSLLKFSIFIYYYFLLFLWALLLMPYILLLSAIINLCYSKLIMNCLPLTILFDHLHTALCREKTPRSCLRTTGSLYIVVGLVWKILINFFKGKYFFKKIWCVFRMHILNLGSFCFLLEYWNPFGIVYTKKPSVLWEM